MPDGVVRWIDTLGGRAGIVREGHTYGARLSDMEPSARQVGARVHFDAQHLVDGERAVQVRIRGGMRTDPHHHRVGTMAGVHDPGAGSVSGFVRRHVEYRKGLGIHPLQVVSAWASQLAAGDLDESVALYSPDSAVHLDNVALTSPRHIRHRLETLPVFASGRLPAVRGEQDLVVARWEAPNTKEEALEVRSLVRDGLIIEQWVAPAVGPAGPAALETPYGPVPLATLTRGAVPPEVLDYAVSRIKHVVEDLDEPVLSIRIKLSEEPDPARSRRALAQASVDINGQVVRSHVAAHELHEAVDLLERRLADRIEHRAQRIEALRRHTPGRAEPGLWRHGDLPTVRPEFFDRPPEERRLVRHKAFFAAEQSVDEAMFDMDLLDYDFYLFSDLATGDDSLLERCPSAICRLHRLQPVVGERATSAYEVETDPAPAPVLTTDEAIERLAGTGSRFVFFAGADSGRGRVVYRRYDGHYGLITLE